VLQSATLDRQQLVERVAHLEAALAGTQTTLARVTAERDKLRRAYEQLKEQVELLRRRIYIAKAERVDVTQLEMEFAETRAKLDALAKQLDDDAALPAATDGAESDPADPPPSAKTRSKPTGRRNLADEDLPEERVEIRDPAFEGHEPISFEESYKLKYRRAGHVRLVVARAIYQTERAAEQDAEGAQSVLITTRMPRELFPRGLLAPSLIC
jgi:transposase